MGNIMILAPTVRDGRAYARKHGLDWRDVFTPEGTYSNRLRPFDDFVILGDVQLDAGQWAMLTRFFLDAGADVLDRFYYAAQGKLPPPIELPRVKVVKL